MVRMKNDAESRVHTKKRRKEKHEKADNDQRNTVLLQVVKIVTITLNGNNMKKEERSQR